MFIRVGAQNWAIKFINKKKIYAESALFSPNASKQAHSQLKSAQEQLNLHPNVIIYTASFEHS
jgi:hypothetical protein